jgi:hypothetical protein
MAGKGQITGKYGKKVSWNVKLYETFGKYRRKYWKDMNNMEETQVEMWHDMENTEETQVEMWKDMEIMKEQSVE